MAQKVQVLVTCDLEHKTETAGDETVQFSFDGMAYEIDLCAKHAKSLSETVAQYRDSARRAGSASARRRPRNVISRDHSREVREWAKTNNIAVSERGRIPAGVIQRYEAAH